MEMLDGGDRWTYQLSAYIYVENTRLSIHIIVYLPLMMEVHMHDKNRISEIVRAGYLKNLTGKQIARKLNAEGLTTKRGVRFAQHTVSDYALRVLGLRRVVQQNSKMAMDRQIAMPVADLENRISSQVKSAAQSLSRMDTTPRLDQEKIDTMLAVATSDLRSDLKSKLFLRILKDGAL